MSSPLPISAVANGRYEIRQLLGEGSRKRVYLAHDTRLDRDVALALVKTEGLDAAGLARVRREAQAMGRLGDHPHIVTVHDVGEEDGRAFIVSQFMAGGSVEDALRGQRSKDQEIKGLSGDFGPHDSLISRPLPVAEVLRLGHHVCRALEHAHSHGVIHRDLKPANVWLTADGTAKLGDFGLALERDRSRVTVEGLMVGTVAYMAPEQALGKVVDARTDLYAFGALLYEMVTGRPPFVADDAVAVISQHLHTAPMAPSWHNGGIPQTLERLILALLEKDPVKRPPHAAAVREALERVQTEVKGLRTEEPSSPAQSSVLVPQSSPSASNPLDRLDAGVFVGREKEMTTLRAAIEDALAGRGCLALIGGEPGIGKTRMAQELATYAQLRGMQVLWGRGYEGTGAPAYWPWVQIMRGYVHERSPQELHQEMGPGAADIANVFSVVRERLPDLPPPRRLEPEQERFRLFDSVTTFFKNAAAHRPLMLVLDDVHWADPSSLLLLQFLAREMRETRLMVVGTYRDEAVQHGQPWFQTLAEVTRATVGQRMLLGGLSEAEIAQLIERTAGEKPLPSLVTAVARQTEGNPFFVGEVVRWLVAEGRLQHAGQGALGVPPGIREVVGRRLERLSPDCFVLLMTAAVIRREFNADLLAAVASLSMQRVLELCDEAVAARILTDAGTAYSFTHALIPETLLSDIAKGRRLRLHRQIGEALASLYDQSLDQHAAELAYHFAEAAPLGETGRAVSYGRRAGERAMALLAYEDAVNHYQCTLRFFSGKESADEREHAELLLALGDAQWKAGQSLHARQTFRQTAALAQRLGAPELLARAALGAGAWQPTSGMGDASIEQLLEEACTALAQDETPLRARVLAQLAVWQGRLQPPQRRLAMAHEAVDLARRLGDPATLALVLHTACRVLYEPDNLELRLALTAEEVSASEQTGDQSLASDAHCARVWTLLQRGDITAVDAEIEVAARLADESRYPQKLWRATYLRAMRAILAGRFDEAETLAWKSLEFAQRVQELGEAAAQVFGVQMFGLHRFRGRLNEIESSVAAFVERSPSPAWRCVLAVIHSELGRVQEARRALETLAQHSYADLPRDWLWLCCLDMLADVCAFVADAHHANGIYDLLHPYAEHYIVVADGTLCQGSVSRALGRLAATMQRWDTAIEHYERAIEMNKRMNATPWVAYTHYHYADALLRRGAPGDAPHGLRLLNDTIDTANRLGMKPLLEHAIALKFRVQGVDSTDTTSSIDVVASTVRNEHPDLRAHAAPDGTVTLLFSDIEGFTALTNRLGDHRAHAVLQAHNHLIREQLARHGGFEVKSQGDGFMVAFQSARRAILCAIAVQRALAGYAAEHPEEPIRVRIGLHTGETIKEGDHYAATTPHLAARIAAQARGGEILVSAVLKELTESAGDLCFGAGRAVMLKGVSGVRTVFAVPWAGELSATTAVTEPPANTAVLRHEGAYWTLMYEGTTGRLKDTRGLHYLAQLLRHPGREFHVLDLVQRESAVGSGQPVLAIPGSVKNPGLGTRDPGLEVLDATAKTAYKRRLAELREELEEAEQLNDAGHAERAREEIEAISEQLASAVGLGGRNRTTASAAQRARVATTKRIKDALARVTEQHHVLGDSLSRCVRTGVFCVYLPDAAHAIDWLLD